MASVNLDIAQRLDITCRKGDTFSLTLNMTDSAGTAINLSAYTFTMQVRDASTDADKGFTFDFSENDGGTTGKLVITSTDVDTAGSYIYDLQTTETAPDPDVIQTWLYGTFIVNDDVTTP